jgi:hypothetical protein
MPDTMGAMWPHFVRLLWRSWSSLVSALGTTTLAVVVGLAGFLFILALNLASRLKKDGWRWEVMSSHFSRNLKESLFPTAIGTLILWSVLFGWFVIKSVYADHMYFVAKVQEARSQGTASTSEIKGSLTEQLSALQKQNMALKADVERHRHSMVTTDPVFGNTVNLLQAFQLYRGGRHGEPCVMYFTAPKESRLLASMVAQFSNSVSGCFTFGPFDVEPGSLEERLALSNMNPDFIICHISEGDRVASDLCGELSAQLMVKESYIIPTEQERERLYSTPAKGKERFVWLQFGTNAQWKSEYFKKPK